MITQILRKLKDGISGKKEYAVAISVVIFLILVLFSLTETHRLFELKLYDLRFRIKPSIDQWEHLTFLDIDDTSIANAGEFPWPRHRYADGLETLRKVGASQFTFDIQFLDPSPLNVDEKRLNEIKNKKKISPSDIDSLLRDNDTLLAEAIKQHGSVILPYSFLKDPLERHFKSKYEKEKAEEAYKLFTEKASIPLDEYDRDAFRHLIDPERQDIQYVIPALIESTSTFGYVDSDFDIDGTARKIRLIRVFKDRIYFHMSLVMLMDMTNVKKESLIIDPGKNITLPDAMDPTTGEKRDIVIPVDTRGQLYINWAGPLESTFNHLSYYSLFEYSQARAEIHDYFNEEDARTGNSTRKQLLDRRTVLLRDLQHISPESNRRNVIISELRKVQSDIAKIEKEYLRDLEKGIPELEQQIKEHDSEQIRSTLKNLKTYITAVKIVTGVENLAGQYIITGLTATATQDIGVIPVSSEYMMVGTYHNVLNTILQGEYIRKAPGWINYLCMLLIALIIGLAMQRLPAVHSVIALGISFIVINGIIILLFSAGNIWLDELSISLSLLLPGVAVSATKFISEESQKRYIKSAFSRYLSPKVIEEIMDDPDSLQLGGEKREISIFFSDVAGFSTISEQLTPEELVALLNEYLSQMTDIIMEKEGTVDKFEGDAIMAFYGAPQNQKDHAIRACLAALDMKQRLAEMREVWNSIGQHELKVRMGINTGDAVVGNMGSRTRMDYTAMGDSVNLASRLEGANKAYGTFAIISEATYEKAKDHIEARRLDRIRVIGKEEPIMVYELLQRKGQLPSYMHEMLEKYYEGLELFEQRDWANARKKFKAGLKLLPDDGPCQTYYDRCSEFMKKPPSKNWDGVYRLKTK